jgi:xanthine dehydrogenase YagS FAD-binding subunit
MKTFANRNPASLREAIDLARAARQAGQSVSFASGGTDLLQLVKDRIPNRPGSAAPDVLINLKTIPGMADLARGTSGGLSIGGLVALSRLAADAFVRDRFAALAEAAESVGSPQIRNVGTVAGNLVQRPWCWYYRNGFPCYKAGGDRCFSAGGENQLHAIFGGGPSYIVHPSDLAPALVAMGATFRVEGPGGERVLPAAEFFVLPRVDAEHENVLADDEVLVSVDVPPPSPTVRATYRKVMDRETWTHALASVAMVLDIQAGFCRDAHIVLGGVAPVPWSVPDAARLLIGQRVTAELAARVAAAAVADARPLARNAYKVPLTRGLVERTLLSLAA